MIVQNDIDCDFEMANPKGDVDEKKEEYDPLLIPLDEHSDRFHDPPTHGKSQTEKQEQQYGTVAGVSFSVQFVATIVLLLLIASQGIVIFCCRISVHIRNEVFQRQHSRIQQNDPTFRKNSTIPILRKYRLNVESATIWSSASKKASKVETVYAIDDIVVEEDMSSISRFDEQS
jgi:hypothetical protein